MFQEAFIFTKEEAEKQILKMNSTIMDILENGDTKGKASVVRPLYIKGAEKMFIHKVGVILYNYSVPLGAIATQTEFVTTKRRR
jgi:hypothetical protein